MLEPGGEITGFLYFEKVEADDDRVTIRAVVAGDEGDTVGEVRIPYEVRG